MSRSYSSYGFEPGLEEALRVCRDIADEGAPALQLIAREHGVPFDELQVAYAIWAAGPEGQWVIDGTARAAAIEGSA